MSLPDHGPLILVVDDDLAMLELLASVLDEEGYVVRTAPGGLQALAMIDQEPPGLVLLDWMMPTMRGDEVLRKLRAGPHHALPVVILSANGDARALLAEGANAFIPKPFDLDALLSCVARFVRNT